MLFLQHQMRDDPCRKEVDYEKGNPFPDRNEFRPEETISLQHF